MDTSPVHAITSTIGSNRNDQQKVLPDLPSTIWHKIILLSSARTVRNTHTLSRMPTARGNTHHADMREGIRQGIKLLTPEAVAQINHYTDSTRV